MRLALECPTPLLDMIQPFADFDFILANLMKSDKAYADYYKKSTNYKMLDNGVTETGEPLPIEEIHEIASELGVDLVIARDWIGDYEKTARGYMESVKKFGESMVVGVLQGSSPEEALKCLNFISPKSPMIMVPYHVGGSDRRKDSWLMALRRTLVVAHIPADRSVHLLGFTTLAELSWYVGRPNVVSIDTDVPVKAGLVVQDIDDFDRSAKVTATSLTKESWAAVCRNIALLRKFMP